MRRSIWLATLLASSLAAAPVSLIFDTDMGNDIDDALALAVIHALESRGEAKLLAVTITKDNPKAAPFVDALNTFYGRGDTPIGVVRNGSTPEEGKYLGAVADDAKRFPRDLMSGKDAPEAVGLLKRILKDQPDGSVVMVQVGFSTNLVRLIGDEEGRELVKRKVRLLSLMGGAFPTISAEYNIKIDLASSKKLTAEWPTPIVFSGFEIGKALLYPAESIERDYAYTPNHPIPPAYRAYMKMPYDRPTWDLTSVLYAVRPDRGYFSLSPEGRVSVDDGGYTRFTPEKGGPHRFLTLSDTQKTRTLEALVELSSQPPKR
ncbi:MAG: nucleoside hydrolase [Bryobacterales bacterium]